MDALEAIQSLADHNQNLKANKNVLYLLLYGTEESQMRLEQFRSFAVVSPQINTPDFDSEDSNAVAMQVDSFKEMKILLENFIDLSVTLQNELEAMYIVFNFHGESDGTVRLSEGRDRVKIDNIIEFVELCRGDRVEASETIDLYLIFAQCHAHKFDQEIALSCQFISDIFWFTSEKYPTTINTLSTKDRFEHLELMRFARQSYKQNTLRTLQQEQELERLRTTTEQQHEQILLLQERFHETQQLLLQETEKTLQLQEQIYFGQTVFFSIPKEIQGSPSSNEEQSQTTAPEAKVLRAFCTILNNLLERKLYTGVHYIEPRGIVAGNVVTMKTSFPKAIIDQQAHLEGRLHQDGSGKHTCLVVIEKRHRGLETLILKIMVSAFKEMCDVAVEDLSFAQLLQFITCILKKCPCDKVTLCKRLFRFACQQSVFKTTKLKTTNKWWEKKIKNCTELIPLGRGQSHLSNIQERRQSSVDILCLFLRTILRGEDFAHIFTFLDHDDLPSPDFAKQSDYLDLAFREEQGRQFLTYGGSILSLYRSFKEWEC